MAHAAYREILLTVGAQPPESGGILLGPVGSNQITRFTFDETATSSGVTYTPDYVTLRRRMREEWIPGGVDMKGFAHSHPISCERLSTGDLVYIQRLLDANPDMDQFAAPIVMPGLRFHPFVVWRAEPSMPREARLLLF